MRELQPFVRWLGKQHTTLFLWGPETGVHVVCCMPNGGSAVRLAKQFHIRPKERQLNGDPLSQFGQLLVWALRGPSVAPV